MLRKFFFITILLFTIIVLFGVTISRADTISQIQAKIDAANTSRATLEKEIANYQDQLKVINDQANTLKNTIKSLDVSTTKITKQVSLAQNNLNQTSYSIEDTSSKIQDKEQQINIGNIAIKNFLRQINEADAKSFFEIMLSNQSITDFWNEVETTIQVQAKIGDQVASTKDVKSSLEKAKADLEKKKKELEDYTKQLADQKQVLQSTKKDKTNLLTTTKNSEANYQKLLKDKLALKDALDKEINAFETQIKMVVDPKSFPSAGKGILKWPVENVYITQNFGKTSVSGRLYVSGTHNGIDFRAPIGTKVMSAGSGTVEGVGDTDPVCPGASYGKWVFIRYDNGLASAYGHLSLITATAGQKVKAGDIVAYSGSTGYSTGPHLHMSVWAGQGVKVSTLKSTVCKGTYTIPMGDLKAYLDPLVYL